LSDITFAYGGCDAIRECAAIAVKDPHGTWVGLAFVPACDNPSRSALLAFGQARLPDFMIPSQFLPFDTLPLRENGKLDVQTLRAKLQALGRDAGRAVEATGDSRLDALRRLLGMPTLGLDDNYFDAGGDSLGAIRIVSAINRVTGDAALRMADFYATPTLRSLCAHLENTDMSASIAEPAGYHIFRIV